MNAVFQPWQLILVSLAGRMNRKQQQMIEYLQEENTVLKEHLKGKRIRSTDKQRCRLAAKAKVLGRKPSAEELILLKRSLERGIASFTEDPEAARRFLSHGDSKPTSEVPPATRAAWAALCLNLLNLDETLNKE